MAAGGGGVARGADVMGAHGLQTGHGGARAHSPVVQAPDGITVVRAMARHRWRRSQYVGSRCAEASAEGGSGAPEAGGEQAEAVRRR